MSKGIIKVHLDGSDDKVPGIWTFYFDTMTGGTAFGRYPAPMLGYKASGMLRGITYRSNARWENRRRFVPGKRGQVQRVQVDAHIHTLKGRFSVEVFRQGDEGKIIIDQLGGDFTIEFHPHQLEPWFGWGGSGSVKAEFIYDPPRPGRGQNVRPASFTGTGNYTWEKRPTNMIEGKNFRVEFASIGSSLPFIKSGKALPDTSGFLTTSAACHLGVLTAWDMDTQVGRTYSVALVGGLLGAEIGAGEDFIQDVKLQKPCPDWNNATVLYEKGLGIAKIIKVSLFEKMTIQLPTMERVTLTGSVFQLKFKGARVGGHLFGALSGRLKLIRTSGK